MAKIFYADDDNEFLDFAKNTSYGFNKHLPVGSELLDVVAHHMQDGIIPQPIASIIKNDTYDAVVLDYNWGGGRQALLSLVSCEVKAMINRFLYLAMIMRVILQKKIQILILLTCNIWQRPMVSENYTLLLHMQFLNTNNHKLIYQILNK